MKVFTQTELEEMLKALLIDGAEINSEKSWNAALRTVGKGLGIELI